jgi:hypothetical protein
MTISFFDQRPTAPASDRERVGCRIFRVVFDRFGSAGDRVRPPGFEGNQSVRRRWTEDSDHLFGGQLSGGPGRRVTVRTVLVSAAAFDRFPQRCDQVAGWDRVDAEPVVCSRSSAGR